MLQPRDIENWVAVPLPKHAKHVCNNSLYCAGLGPCAIRGADFDGDVFMFCSDPDLLELLALTPSGRDVPEFSNAVKEVRTRLERTTKQPIHTQVTFNVSPWPPALCLRKALRVCMPNGAARRHCFTKPFFRRVFRSRGGSRRMRPLCKRLP